MFILIILGIIALGVGLYLTLAGRKTEESLPQFGLLAIGAGIYWIWDYFMDVPVWASAIFWLVWLAALAVAILLTFTAGWRAALAAFVIGVFALFMGGFFQVTTTPTANVSVVETVTTKASDGTTETMEIHGKKEDKVLAAHETVNDTFATASIPDNGTPVTSWTDLWNRVHALPDEAENKYIEAFNNRANALGITWDEVPALVDAEKRGFDSRVIKAQNVGAMTDEEIRQLAKAVAGELAATLPIVRAEGATVTTNGGTGSAFVLENWADGRPSVGVLLTVPSNMDKPAANTVAAASSVGVNGWCKNLEIGLIKQPIIEKKRIKQPQDHLPKQPKPTPSQTKPVETPPATTPPATTPPATTPPATTPPATTPPATTPPATTPPATTPPATTPPATTPPATTPPATTPPATTPPGKEPTKDPVVVGNAPDNGAPVTAEPTAAPPLVKESEAPAVVTTPAAPAPIETIRTEAPTPGPNEGASTQAPVEGTADEETCEVCGGGIGTAEATPTAALSLLALPLWGLGFVSKKRRNKQYRRSH